MQFFILIVVFFFFSPWGGQQESPPVFKTQVNWIYLNVTVANRDGRFVPGLGRDNFEVYEDGVLQKIEFLSTERQPLFLTVLIDVSGSMSDKFEEIRDAILHILDGLSWEDTARVILFSHQIKTIENVRERREDFMRAFKKVELAGETRLYDTLDLTLRQRSGFSGHRRGIIMISDGKDTASLINFRSLVEKTKEANGPIYTLGIGQFRRSRRYLGKTEVNENVLQRISKVTGGRFYLVAGEHRKGERDVVDYYCHLILDELKTQYLIAYVPSNPAKDSKWREIKVKVKDKKYAVRTRSGYYAGSS